MSKQESEHADLSSVATSTLERLREGIATDQLRTPLARAAIIDHGVRHQLDALEAALSGHSRGACLSVLDAVLAERRANARPAPELVWSGPERAHATARDTAVVLRSLFESAQQQVILAGYNFTKGRSLLEPLWIAMRDRGVDVRFFVHIEQAGTRLDDPNAYAAAQLAASLGGAWPFGSPQPKFYCDPRALVPGPPYSSLHAKCVVVDGTHALVTSANFTLRAQELNIECGVLLEDPTFAHHLARQWLGLIDACLVLEADL